jgi:hypothetical protein
MNRRLRRILLVSAGETPLSTRSMKGGRGPVVFEHACKLGCEGVVLNVKNQFRMQMKSFASLSILSWDAIVCIRL